MPNKMSVVKPYHQNKIRSIPTFDTTVRRASKRSPQLPYSPSDLDFSVKRKVYK